TVARAELWRWAAHILQRHTPACRIRRLTIHPLAMRRLRTTNLVVAFIALVFFWCSFVTPRGLVLNDRCALDGRLAEWRAWVQGISFWQAQLAAVDAAIDAPREWWETQQRVAAVMEPARRRSQYVMDSIYLTNPALPRPRRSM